MHVACERGLYQLVSSLLEEGGNPNLQTLAASETGGAHRQTPLHIAIANKYVDSARVIIDFASMFSLLAGSVYLFFLSSRKHVN